MKIESFVHSCLAIKDQPFEVTEIKGRGHPDTICDLVCEQLANDLLKFYRETCGRVLHFNVDKAFLVGGKSKPRFGGGEIQESAKLYLGDRATETFNGHKLALAEMVLHSVGSWFSNNVRFVRLDHGLKIFNEIKPSSASLSSVEEIEASNDTSVGVGSWPPTPLESAAINLEKYLNSQDLKKRYPETGEDIKVMAVRNGSEIRVVCAIAMVDRFVGSLADYREKKEILKRDISQFLSESNSKFAFSVDINTLDNFENGEDGLHLTVTGLSCESGDSGQVGRGNRVNGAISFMRPQTMEAWAGKNPITHVGKIYSFVAQKLAKQLCDEVPEVEQADVFLVGQIGNPVRKPAHAYCNLVTRSTNPKALTEVCNLHLRRALESGLVFNSLELTRAL